MQFSRLVLLGMATVLIGCDSDSVTDSGTVPPVANVRFINAVADTGAVDIRFIDQVDLSAIGNGLLFRAGTIYQQTESKSRRLRVFPRSLDPAITSRILLDTTLTIQADTRVTLLLTGASRTAGALKLVVINDDPQAPPSGQISVRMVNASSGTVNGYLVSAVGDALPGTATFPNVGNLGTSAYVNRATGAAAVRVTDAGSATVNASLAGPAAPAALAGAFPGAGVTSPGTGFSAYYFPRANVGSVTTPGVVWFVDRNPCDAGC